MKNIFFYISACLILVSIIYLLKILKTIYTISKDYHVKNTAKILIYASENNMPKTELKDKNTYVIGRMISIFPNKIRYELQETIDSVYFETFNLENKTEKIKKKKIKKEKIKTEKKK